MIIDNFDKIKLYPNSLVFIDLNKTIISYIPNKKNDLLVKKYIKGILTNEEYLKIITTHKPYIINKNKFNEFMNNIKKSGSKIIILTSLNNNIKNYIKKSIKKSNIPIKKILFSNNKGKTIKNIKSTYKYNKLLFIDDSLKKIKTVKKFNPETIIYQIKHKL